MKDKIKRSYAMGLWSADMVDKAGGKGVLTAEEAEEIMEGGSGR